MFELENNMSKPQVNLNATTDSADDVSADTSANESMIDKVEDN